ncbi:TPA: hypothetical protein EYP83_00750 [Candidatus Geothermarchaeota archaeon]|nr:hypothetical protein [Candidatus Geothermarchaeota archaeon]HIQ13054.1 hypothetical protein [Thermoprotei archaeon]
MSIEALRREILSTAEKEKIRILNDAEIEAKKIVDEANEKALSIIERKRAYIESELKNRREVAIAVKRLEGRRMVYEQLIKLLDEVRQGVLRELNKLRNSDDYLDIISRYIVEGLKELNIFEAKVLFSSLDKEFFDRNSKKITNNVIKMVGRDVKLDFIDSGQNFLGGVIVCDKEENTFYVSTFDGRLNRIFEERLDEILNILRGDVNEGG